MSFARGGYNLSPSFGGRTVIGNMSLLEKISILLTIPPAGNFPVKPDDILVALQDLTGRERIEFSQAAPESRPLLSYPPIEKYLLDLKNNTKPESAAEDLFTALCKDVLGFQPTRQVGSGEGWVDFVLPEKTGELVPLELKPLFQRDGLEAVWSKDANPKHHVAQVKKYLRDHEYLILTDLRTLKSMCST